MSKAYVEIDFFQMEKRNVNTSKPSSPERAPSSFRGIQSVVSRINPQLLKTVMAAGATAHAGSSDDIPARRPTSPNPPSPSRTPPPPPLPVYKPASTCSVCPTPATAPLTIFYNGTITTFDVPGDKAEAIMRMAERSAVVNPAERRHGSRLDDLPIPRRKSLLRFLEKRKERFASASPYHKSSPPVPCLATWC